MIVFIGRSYAHLADKRRTKGVLFQILRRVGSFANLLLTSGKFINDPLKSTELRAIPAIKADATLPGAVTDVAPIDLKQKGNRARILSNQLSRSLPSGGIECEGITAE